MEHSRECQDGSGRESVLQGHGAMLIGSPPSAGMELMASKEEMSRFSDLSHCRVLGPIFFLRNARRVTHT